MRSTQLGMWSILFYFQRNRKLIIRYTTNLPPILKGFSKRQIYAVIQKLQSNGLVLVVYQHTEIVILYITPAGKRLADKMSWVNRPKEK